MRGLVLMQVHCIDSLWEVLLEGAACEVWIEGGTQDQGVFEYCTG